MATPTLSTTVILVERETNCSAVSWRLKSHAAGLSTNRRRPSKCPGTYAACDNVGALLWDMTNMHIETIVVGEFQVNCYLLWNDSNNVIVIDPGGDAGIIIDYIAKRKLSVVAYLLTHGHMDHISALAEVHDAYPAPIGLHGADLKWAFDKQNQMPPFYGIPRKPSEIARTLEDGQEWKDAGLAYRVILTPGHTPGSVCFHFEQGGVLLTGDTLFAGSVGRTDLPGGNSRVLAASLKKLAALPGKTVIYPGHGPSSSMAAEKETNYFMQGL
jgi:hydroxyacylglutathione hydrolase